MYNVKELLDLCKNKGMDFFYDDRSMFFERVNFSRVDKMLDRLNVCLDRDKIDYIIENNKVVLDLNDTNVDILYNLICNDEYLYGMYKNGLKHDIKLGWSCNNNCIHCVVKPHIFDIQKQCPDKMILDSGYGMWYKDDFKYEDIIKILQEDEKKNVSDIVITGGEPTLRKDLIDILKWIYYNQPYLQVAMQTNGRNLSDIDLVKKIRRYSRYISFVIAVHGLEKTHNRIVNNRKEKGNPYKETIQGIQNLRKVFGDDLNFRTEIVLSKYNYNEVCESVKFQHEELGCNVIGISYPHLEGFSQNYIDSICPSYEDLFNMIKELNEYNQKHKDLIVALEEFPKCVLHQSLESLDCLFEDMCSEDSTKNTIVNYIDNTQNDFDLAWKDGHRKSENCNKCCFNDSCPGVWFESYHMNERYLVEVN